MLTTIRGVTLAIQPNSPPTIRAKPHPRSLGATLRGERARAKSSQSGGTPKCTRHSCKRQAGWLLGYKKCRENHSLVVSAKLLAHHVERASAHLVVDASQVLADDPQKDQLDAAHEEDEDQRRR